MLALSESFDWGSGLGQETDRVIAGVEDCRWWQIDLRTRWRLRSGGYQLVEAGGGQLDVVDYQASDVAIDEVDDHLRLSQYASTVAWRNAFDGSRKICRIAAGKTGAKSEDDDCDAERYAEACKKELFVELPSGFRRHPSILADLASRATVVSVD